MYSPYAIIEDCGLNITSFDPVHGGSINHSFCLRGTDGKYFLKVNNESQFPGMFEKEARGLRALGESNTLTLPIVIRTGFCDQQQYLLMEWIELGKPKSNFWQNFGVGLATLHKKEQQNFGWVEDNYIGSVVQQNQSQSDWNTFFTEFRILPLVKKLVDAGAFTRTDLAQAESYCKNLNNIFPDEHPSLLHGDLWSGNFMVNNAGEPVIFDPAVYCGHREMDLGMTKLFGGFDTRFYHAYDEVYPLERGWQQRCSLTQLHPILVHAILFEGHYISLARDILNSSS